MKDLTLLNTISKSRLFRTRDSVKEASVVDAAELSFVYFMILSVWNKDPKFADLARRYADKTKLFPNFDTYKTNGTDLYLALNRILGKDQEYEGKDAADMKRIGIKTLDIKRYLSHVSKNVNDPQFENTMLLKFQNELNIQDSMLRSLRRLVVSWDELSHQNKSLVVTRLMQYIRLRAMKSDAYLPMAEFQRHGEYKIDDKNDTKKNAWDSPIIKAAGAAAGLALMYGSRNIGKKLGNSGLDQAGGEIPSRFPTQKDK